MESESTKKEMVAKKKSPPKAKKVVPKSSPAPVAMKTVRNVSLQAWPIPVGGGSTIHLNPGSSMDIPASAVTDRLINLMKRRLISIR